MRSTHRCADMFVDPEKRNPGMAGVSLDFDRREIDQKLIWVRSAYCAVSSPLTSFSPFV
jgi:hypothetical protein